MTDLCYRNDLNDSVFMFVGDMFVQRRGLEPWTGAPGLYIGPGTARPGMRGTSPSPVWFSIVSGQAGPRAG